MQTDRPNVKIDSLIKWNTLISDKKKLSSQSLKTSEFTKDVLRLWSVEATNAFFNANFWDWECRLTANLFTVNKNNTLDLDDLQAH